MKNKIIYFSPTGNAKYIAEKLMGSLDTAENELFALEFTEPETLTKSDQLIIIFSIHAFNPPRTVRHFIKRLPEGLAESVSLIAVGCTESWVNEAATSGLRRIFEKKGYSNLIERVIAMPLTFILSFPAEMAVKLLSDAEQKIKSAAEDIRLGVKTTKETSFKSKVLHFIGKAEEPAARLFGLELHAGKKCTSCGTCVKGCPEKNIRFSRKNQPIFSLSCLMCMRCIYNCPEKTVSPRIARFIPIKGGYRISDYQ